MRQVKITKEQAHKLGSRKVGLTSGIRNKETGKREEILFCSSLDFSHAFGYKLEKEFIEI